MKVLLQFCFLNLILLSMNVAKAEIFLNPIGGVAAGKYEDLSYTEARAGVLISFSDQFIRGEAVGFYRFVDGIDNFSGVDLSVQVQRWFQITNKFLLGTRIGPGYRWASNDYDAPLLDFSVSFQHLELMTFRVGYKLLFHELSDSDNPNESMVYISFEL